MTKSQSDSHSGSHRFNVTDAIPEEVGSGPRGARDRGCRAWWGRWGGAPRAVLDLRHGSDPFPFHLIFFPSKSGL
jgi:hypothetical protein